MTAEMKLKLLLSVSVSLQYALTELCNNYTKHLTSWYMCLMGSSLTMFSMTLISLFLISCLLITFADMCWTTKSGTVKYSKTFMGRKLDLE